ncbi:effector-associated constant component EACC1 [Actinomadura terrae]|uniref:effector-associated constant component EACC1 n=1 Tax=Actinomadura terrae TaxID=604353 RepID=UPI001FA6C9DE|nr:hypothetical protein [Actinomadura terrae]
MDLQIEVTGGDEAGEHARLLEWLRADRRLAGHVRVRRRAPGAEELGGTLDAVMVAVGSGGVSAVLAQTLPAWIRSRRPKVKFTLTTEDGERLELETADAAEAPRLIAELLRHHHGASD